MNTDVMASFFKWGNKHNRQLITAAVFSLMLISLGLQFYTIYSEISNHRNVSAQHNQISASNHSEQKLKPSDFELLFGFNERPEAPPKTADIPKTRLNLTLHGALAGLQQQPESSAIIQGSNQEKVYQIGDTLPGGAILSEVHADHVVLKRNGQLEILPFPDSGKESKGLRPYQQQNSESQPSVSPRSDYTKQPDSDSLEQRMRKLREQLQQANQGSS